MDREVVESVWLEGVRREEVFPELVDIEAFPRWAHGLLRARVMEPEGTLRPGSRLEFVLSAAGLTHRITSVVTTVEPPRRLEWRYTGGATGSGGWLLENNGRSVRLTFSTDYRISPAWLDRVAHRPFFLRVTGRLLRRSLRDFARRAPR